MKERTRELSVETVKSALIVLHRLSKHARVNARQTKLFSSHSFMVLPRHPRRQNFSRLFEKFCKNSKNSSSQFYSRLVAYRTVHCDLYYYNARVNIHRVCP